MPPAEPVSPESPATASSPAGTPEPSPPALESPPVESPAVAARFPDPTTTFATPAFEPDHSGFTSNAELTSLLQRVASANTDAVQLIQAGSSQTGVPIRALVFSRDLTSINGSSSGSSRPTVLLIGQQHGDEPAGAEALLVIAQRLAGGGPLAPLLDKINVVILPRANPDGAALNRRLSASGIDINRDHLLLRTPEAQAQAQLVRDYRPAVVVDSHEFLAIGRYQQKFGAVQRFDALIQYAMVANMPAFITRAAEEWFRQPLVKRLREAGLTSEWYYTTSSDPADRKLAMGGAQPDNGRNVDGLRHAVSFLIETRGSDLGRAHLKRRVLTHVSAVGSVLASTAARAGDLMKLRQFVDAEVTAKACQGDVVVEAGPTASEYTVTLLDPVTGADKPMTLAWDSALQLEPSKIRGRPCGYWLSAEQTDAVLRLRGLGVQVGRLEEAGALRGETWRETGREVAREVAREAAREAPRDTASRVDARGTVTDLAGPVSIKVSLVPSLVDAPAGSYYVSLEQPYAHLVVAALEPDTRSSYFASRVVPTVAGAARVMLRPDIRISPVP